MFGCPGQTWVKNGATRQPKPTSLSTAMNPGEMGPTYLFHKRWGCWFQGNQIKDTGYLPWHTSYHSTSITSSWNLGELWTALLRAQRTLYYWKSGRKGPTPSWQSTPRTRLKLCNRPLSFSQNQRYNLGLCPQQSMMSTTKKHLGQIATLKPTSFKLLGNMQSWTKRHCGGYWIQLEWRRQHWWASTAPLFIHYNPP